MGDDINEKFKQIAEMLGKENVNMPDNIGNILSMLVNSAPKEQTSKKETNEATSSENKEIKQENPQKVNLEDNIEMMRKVGSMMDRIKNVNDPRVNLLTAISPFLNNNRQKKIGNCIKLFQMTQITRMMTDMEKNG